MGGGSFLSIASTYMYMAREEGVGLVSSLCFLCSSCFFPLFLPSFLHAALSPSLFSSSSSSFPGFFLCLLLSSFFFLFLLCVEGQEDGSVTFDQVTGSWVCRYFDAETGRGTSRAFGGDYHGFEEAKSLAIQRRNQALMNQDLLQQKKISIHKIADSTQK